MFISLCLQYVILQLRIYKYGLYRNVIKVLREENGKVMTGSSSRKFNLSLTIGLHICVS